MPECYTHVYLATEALMRSGNTVASHPAFFAGANGPDPLYSYRIGRRKPRPDLPGLARRMHHEHTGSFLLALLRYASTPTQQSFALGYLTHYTTDCTLNPYLDAMSTPGMPYAGAGHWKLAADLDSTLYHRDYHSYKVPLLSGTPVLITGDLAQVSGLLREASLEVYGQDLPLLALADAYHDNLSLRRLMGSRSPFKKMRLAAKQPPHAELYGGPLADRVQPAGPLKPLPQHWANPYTNREIDLTLDEVLSLAEQTGAICISTAMRYWLGELDEESLATVLGNNDYATGLPCRQPEMDKPGGAGQEGDDTA